MFQTLNTILAVFLFLMFLGIAGTVALVVINDHDDTAARMELR
jgi:hypothetical protein